ncbi:putative flippase GtrA [Novosphingobium sp. PhB165]|uniref:GtrA family protein n=1 Tax=Novosphingobium sp. PhB165 TaxID=2485105 RepID=UPI00104C2005|nr:GtrA family protein [Novosphingobium sp. PhB165]TCM17104.1 putative flippase GtrA [Novosphingobium sp. PhB165]
MLRSALRFGLVGVVNTLVGFAMIALLLHLGAGDWLANAASYAVGLCVSFTLNRRWTFGVRGAVATQEVTRFLTVFALSYAVNVAVLGTMRSLGFAENLIGQGTAMVAYSAIFFLLSRRFVFSAGASR